MRRALPLAVLSSLSLALPASGRGAARGHHRDPRRAPARRRCGEGARERRGRRRGRQDPRDRHQRAGGSHARRPLGPDAAARPDRRAHARAAAGRRHLGRVRRAAHGRVAAVPDAARHARDEDRARPRLHHAARHRQRGCGLRRRRPEACRRAWSRRRAAAVRRDEGAGADRRLSDPDGLRGSSRSRAASRCATGPTAAGARCATRSRAAPTGSRSTPTAPTTRHRKAASAACPNFTVEELTAIVDQAHRTRVKVAAHSITPSGHAVALAAGVDSIEHGDVLDDATIQRHGLEAHLLVPDADGDGLRRRAAQQDATRSGASCSRRPATPSRRRSPLACRS